MLRLYRRKREVTAIALIAMAVITSVFFCRVMFVSAQEVFYSQPSDGYIGTYNADYLIAHDAATGAVYNTDTNLWVGQKKIPVPSNYSIYRSFLIFDTSSIPTYYDVTSATLTLYLSGQYSDTDFDVIIQNGQPNYPHIPLTDGDFLHSQYSGNYGSINTVEFVEPLGFVEPPVPYEITVTDLSVITKGGTTKLCLRGSTDIDSGPLPTSPTGAQYVYFRSADAINPAQRPYLTISYIVGAAPGDPAASGGALLDTALPILIALTILVSTFALTRNPFVAFAGTVIGLMAFYVIKALLEII